MHDKSSERQTRGCQNRGAQKENPFKLVDQYGEKCKASVTNINTFVQLKDARKVTTETRHYRDQSTDDTGALA